MIVGGMIIMTCGLLLVGGISTINTKPGLSATVAFMCVWGFLVSLNPHETTICQELTALITFCK